MLSKLSKKVKKGIDEYLEFDTDIIWENTDYCEVYGGAIRDIISNNNINDVDFMVLPKSKEKLISILEYNGYIKMEDLVIKNNHEIYKEIKCIFEPITYIKGTKIVQLIRPSLYNKNENDIKIVNKKDIFSRFFELIGEVDMSCNGVSFNGKIRENCNDSILHCLSKVYKVNVKAEMINNKRIEERRIKIEKKGFEEFNHLNKNKELYKRSVKLLERSNKIFNLSYNNKK